MTTSTPLPADLKTRMKASYDAIAPTYNAKLGTALDHIRVDYLTRLLALLGATDKTAVRVLELGCGAGVPSTKTLLDSGIHVTANDLSTTQLALARTNLAEYVESGKVELVGGDMLALEFQPASFDAVTGFYSIIHLPREEQKVLMGKVAGWLKPGGYFLANFAEEEAEQHVDEEWLGEKTGWVYWSGWGAEGSVKMVEECGLEVLDREVRKVEIDASFVWVIGRKGK